MAWLVPRFEAGKLAASSVILADSIEKVPARTIGMGQFVLGDSKVRPRITGIFGRDEKMGIYFQVYGTGDETGSLEYQVTKAGSNQPLIDFTEEIRFPPNGAPQPVTREKMLAPSRLGAGDDNLH